MKEIKFRAWNKKAKVMTITPFGMTSQPKTDDGHAILMQFTGLLDKNGKEVYEGDIVVVRIPEDYGGEDDDEGNAQYLCTQEVKASKTSGGYYTNEDTGEWCPGLGSDEIEVKIIGNIYQNPELLK